LLIVFPASSATGEPTAEVLHWWTAGGEARALKVIADRFTAVGGRWTLAVYVFSGRYFLRGLGAGAVKG
jgi:hypothetical protein